MKWEVIGDESGSVWYSEEDPTRVVEAWPDRGVFFVHQPPHGPITRIKCETVEAAKAIAVLTR